MILYFLWPYKNQGVVKLGVMKIDVWKNRRMCQRCLARTGVIKIDVSRRPVRPALDEVPVDNDWEIETAPL